MVSLNKIPFWGIIEIYFLKLSNLRSEISWSSIIILPDSGRYILYSKLNNVVLPKPLDPTIALVVPGLISNVKF